VFTSAIARLANLSLQTGKFPARYKTVQVLPVLKKKGSTVHRPISNLPTVSKVFERLVLACLRPNYSALQIQPLPVCIQEKKFHGDGTTGGPGRSLHGGRRQAGHCPDRLRPVGGLRHRRPPAPRLPAARVRSDGNIAPLAAVLSQRPDSVHQDGPARITRQ